MSFFFLVLSFFFFNDTATTEIYTLSLHDALPICERRIVEMARNRDLYMRKHHSRAAAAAVRWLTAWAYALRALAALLLPGHSPRRYWRHVVATLSPARREGLREAAEEHNRS